jgi:hypothetical protein
VLGENTATTLSNDKPLFGSISRAWARPRARKLVLCSTWVAVKLFPVRPHVKGVRDVAAGRLPYLLDKMNSSMVILLGGSFVQMY